MHGKKIRKKIRVTQPSLTEQDTIQAVELLKKGWMTQGKETYFFQQEFAKFVRVKHAITTNSGTSSNLIMLAGAKELGIIENGAKIATPALSWISTAAPMLQLGFIPVFFDVTFNPKYFLTMDYDIVKEFMNDVDVIMPIHFCGFFANPAFSSLGKPLFYDSCNTLKKDQDNSLAQTYSFFMSHHITTGEGGMITTHNDELAKVYRSLREYGNACSARCDSPICRVALNPEYICPHRGRRFQFDYLGWNLKMLDIQASVGRNQLKKADEFLRMRRENAKYYCDELAFLRDNGFIIPEYSSKFDWFTFPIITSGESLKNELVKYLAENMIETRPVLGGLLPKQKAFRGKKFYVRPYPTDFSNTKMVDEQGFMIGIHPSITQDDMAFVVQRFKRFIHK